MLRWIENYIAKKSVQLYPKFDNARGSGYARAVAAELDAAETMEELLELGGRQSLRLLRPLMVPPTTVIRPTI